MNYLIIDLKDMKMYPTEHLDMKQVDKQWAENVQCTNSTMDGIPGGVPMFYVNGGTVNNYFTTSSSSCSLHASEEKIKEILLALLEATDENGNRIFTEKAQWYAVYKVLYECQGYPSKISEFCDIMKNWGMDKVTPACTYDSVAKAPRLTNIPTPKVTLWHNYIDKADDKFRKQVVVAMKLMEMLKK